MYRIKTGALRDYKDGPMQVISSRYGSDEVYFEAPPATILPRELDVFLRWAKKGDDNPLIKAAIAHLWFITLHPFEDGNGRIARAITELMLARADKSKFRYYSMSGQIFKSKKEYYRILERTQKGDPEINPWILWFPETLRKALQEAQKLIDRTILKALSWQEYRRIPLNASQQKIITMLLDGFEGNLTSGKLAKICKCSQDTASREIKHLEENRILMRKGAGRSTHCILNCGDKHL